MILFSKRIDAKEALSIGLINQISTKDKLMDDAIAFAEVLAKRPPLAVGAVLRAISAFDYNGLEAGLKVEEEDQCHSRPSPKDCVEGFTAFLEKRDPVFTGEVAFDLGFGSADCGFIERKFSILDLGRINRFGIWDVDCGI